MTSHATPHNLARLGGPASSRVGERLAYRRATPGRVPRWWRDLTAVLAGGTMLFVVALWVTGGGLLAFGTPGDALTTLGRLTGLLSADLLLLQVLGMARIPFVERAYGQDELARLHRVIGFTSFQLLVAHLILITGGYASGSAAGFVGTFVELVLEYPGMLLALAGLVALVMVVVTSIRKARRRLRYESWHLLHLYGYLGAGLALPHQLWAGGDFLGSPAATAFWWGLWGLALASVLAFRIGLPLVRSWRHRLVVARVETYASGTQPVTTVTMTGRQLDRLPAQPGQFFQWRFLDGPGWTRAHPYSLSAAPDGRTLRISAAHVGDGSSRLAALQPGTRVLIEGPYGRLHPGVHTGRPVLLMAGGLGIAPMRALLEGFAAQAADIVLIYRASTDADALFRDEIDEIATRAGAIVYLIVGPRLTTRTSWLPASAGHVSDEAALRHLVPDIADRELYVCGAPGWMAAVETAARQAGLPGDAIHRELFTY